MRGLAAAFRGCGEPSHFQAEEDPKQGETISDDRLETTA
jgi:hypothetical protein